MSADGAVASLRSSMVVATYARCAAASFVLRRMARGAALDARRVQLVPFTRLTRDCLARAPHFRSSHEEAEHDGGALLREASAQ